MYIIYIVQLLLSRTDKAFEVCIFAFHQSVVDVAQPQSVCCNETPDFVTQKIRIL